MRLRAGMTFVEFVVILTGFIVATLFAGKIWEWWGGWWVILAWPMGFGLAMLPFLLLAGLMDLIDLLRRTSNRNRNRRP